MKIKGEENYPREDSSNYIESIRGRGRVGEFKIGRGKVGQRKMKESTGNLVLGGGGGGSMDARDRTIQGWRDRKVIIRGGECERLIKKGRQERERERESETERQRQRQRQRERQRSGIDAGNHLCLRCYTYRMVY